MSDKAFNCLSRDQIERLAILMEEMSEASHVIGKILRHGYERKHPRDLRGPTNREFLEKELGDVRFAVTFMIEAGDLNPGNINDAMVEKRKSVKFYLHEQRLFDPKTKGESGK